jgi:hypothetical protein
MPPFAASGEGALPSFATAGASPVAPSGVGVAASGDSIAPGACEEDPPLQAAEDASRRTTGTGRNVVRTRAL